MVGANSEVQWAIGGQAAKRYTAVYCDEGFREGLGEYAGGLGYANDTMRPWTPALRELRDRVVAWHEERTGRAVEFNVALLNRYDDGAQSLGYHADREEQDPALYAPRASPIASVSLGCERMFGFRRCQLPADQRHRQKVQGAALAAAASAVAPQKSEKLSRPTAEWLADLADGLPKDENIPQTVEYKNDFHWPGPRSVKDEAGSQLPTALEAAAAEASEFGTESRRCEFRLGHGSLICMENSCQFLYRHSLLPEPGLTADAGPRINLTFRSKTSTVPAPHAAVSRLHLGSGTTVRVLSKEELVRPAEAGGGPPQRQVYVGLMPGVSHRPRGFKDTMFHAFESPFVDDAPAVAAARYRTWVCAQPAFLRWVCDQLRGATLLCADDPWDVAHAEGLARLVRAFDGT